MSRVKTVDDVDWCYGNVLCNTNDEDEDDDGHPDITDGVHEYNGCQLQTDAGWFPASYTMSPSSEQMLYYQNHLGGGTDAHNILAPPGYWHSATTAQDDMDVGAKLHDVDPTTDEYERMEKYFQDGAGSNASSGVPQMKRARITRIQRIENLNLWQVCASCGVGVRQHVLTAPPAPPPSPRCTVVQGVPVCAQRSGRA